MLDGAIVPASEKLVSLFEPHADTIVKDGRQRSAQTTVASATPRALAATRLERLA